MRSKTVVGTIVAVISYGFLANVAMEMGSSLLGFTTLMKVDNYNFISPLESLPNNNSDDGSQDIIIIEEETKDRREEEEEDEDLEYEQLPFEESSNANTTQRTKQRLRRKTKLKPIAGPRIQFFNGTKSTCRLEPRLQYLACGIDGHVYLANMTCGTPRYGMYRKQIAIKLGTHEFKDGVLRFDTRDSYGKSVEYFQALHHRLVDSNGTTAKEKDYYQSLFAIFYGTVSIPAELMLPTIAYAHWNCHKRGLEALTRHDHGDTKFVGRVMNYWPQSLPLHEYLDRIEQPLSRRVQQSLIQKLIEMYRYLHRFDVVHCDILNFCHFLYDERQDQLTLVDFERVHTLTVDPYSSSSGKRKKDRTIEIKHKLRHAKKLWQQLQLLVLIGNICNAEPGKPFEEPTIVVPKACGGAHVTSFNESWTWENEPLRDSLTQALQRCSDSLFVNDKESWQPTGLDQRWSLSDIDQHYETLQEWAAF